MIAVEVTAKAIKCAKLQSKDHYQQTNSTPRVYRPDALVLSPNQQCQSTEIHGLALPYKLGVFHLCLEN